ncbi:MAG: hypothetical protein AAB504_03105 [Patescibacteria group bacterium]|mgnify:CR=1 FL=1
MFEKLKNKLKQIQESDEQTKKRWLILMSIVSMAVIVAVWLFFLNSPIGENKAEKIEASEETSFWQVFKVGLSSVSGSGWNEIKNLYSQAIGKMFIEVEK